MDVQENTTAIALAMDNATFGYVTVADGDEGSKSTNNVLLIISFRPVSSRFAFDSAWRRFASNRPFGDYGML